MYLILIYHLKLKSAIYIDEITGWKIEVLHDKNMNILYWQNDMIFQISINGGYNLWHEKGDLI